VYVCLLPGDQFGMKNLSLLHNVGGEEISKDLGYDSRWLICSHSRSDRMPDMGLHDSGTGDDWRVDRRNGSISPLCRRDPF
jgi:hypothetical protein